MSAASDLRWLRKADNWGRWLNWWDSDDAPGTVEIWMMRAPSGRARFYRKGRGQVGPEHASVAAATCWAFDGGWISPDGWDDFDAMFAWNLKSRCFVQAGGADPLGVPA